MMRLRRSIRPAVILAASLAAGGLLAACHRGGVPMAKASPELTRSVSHTVDGRPGYVGRWAVTAADCSRRAWVFSAAAMQTPGPFSCNLEHVQPTPAGYTVDGTCQVGAASAPGRLVFTLTRLGGLSLTVSGGPFPEPVALARCPAPVTTAAAPTAVGDG
jgi:hypothetical protein